jgi:Kef-type K+ transport system membrane component KefB
VIGDISSYLLALRDTFSVHLVFGVGILLTGSYFLGKLAVRIGVPAITGFIVAGLLLGPSALGFVHENLAESLDMVTELALAIIALVIGSEFNISKLRRIGRAVVVITLAQLLATFLIVTAAVSLTGMLPLPAAALLGAIASATAPAATVAIVRDLKARGPFVDHLYGIVALDDAGCVLLFSVVAAFAGTSMGGASAPLLGSILHAMAQICSALLLGALAGFLLHLATKKLERNNEIFIISLGLVCILTAVATSLHISPLLAGMVAGAVLANFSHKSIKVLTVLDSLSPPLYAAFFAIAGTELDFSVFSSGPVLLLGLVFIVARAVGKYGGVLAGAVVARSDRLIKRYLGLAMLPQAGVAIGLALFLQTAPFLQEGLHEYSRLMVNVVLLSVFVNELAGPPVSRYAVIRGATL